MMGMAIQDFCDEMSTLPEEIHGFGGGACSADPYCTTTYVFSNAQIAAHTTARKRNLCLIHQEVALAGCFHVLSALLGQP